MRNPENSRILNFFFCDNNGRAFLTRVSRYQGYQGPWSFENALDLENEASSAPTQEQTKVHSRVCMRKRENVYEWKYVFLSLFFLFIIPFLHRTSCITAGSEFKNPDRLDMQQTCDYVGISNPTSITLLGQYSHFAHERRERHNEEAQRWDFIKPTKSKPTRLWENQS